MTHLSQYIAETIARNLADHKFDEQIKVAETKMHEFGLRILHYFVDLDFCNSLPEGFLEEGCQIYVRTGENHTYSSVYFGKCQRLPYKVKNKTQLIDMNDPNWVAYKDAKFALENINKDKKDNISKLEKHIFNFKTIKKLLREWPEIAPFVADKYKTPKAAIVVPIKELNQQFGLPVESAGAQ